MSEYEFLANDKAHNHKAGLELWASIQSAIADYPAATVRVLPKTITDKQRRAMWLWFTQCAGALNEQYVPFYSEFGKKGMWNKDRFHAMFKRFIEHYKGLKSTKDQGTQGMNECMEAITAHIATDHGASLPPFPSLEQMSIDALLANT